MWGLYSHSVWYRQATSGRVAARQSGCGAGAAPGEWAGGAGALPLRGGGGRAGGERRAGGGGHHAPARSGQALPRPPGPSSWGARTLHGRTGAGTRQAARWPGGGTEQAPPGDQAKYQILNKIRRCVFFVPNAFNSCCSQIVSEIAADWATGVKVTEEEADLGLGEVETYEDVLARTVINAVAGRARIGICQRRISQDSEISVTVEQRRSFQRADNKTIQLHNSGISGNNFPFFQHLEGFCFRAKHDLQITKQLKSGLYPCEYVEKT